MQGGYSTDTANPLIPTLEKHTLVNTGRRCKGVYYSTKNWKQKIQMALFSIPYIFLECIWKSITPYKAWEDTIPCNSNDYPWERDRAWGNGEGTSVIFYFFF